MITVYVEFALLEIFRFFFEGGEGVENCNLILYLENIVLFPLNLQMKKFKFNTCFLKNWHTIFKFRKDTKFHKF